MSVSLSFLREVAQRIDASHAPSAAHAALELAVRRSGAMGGAIHALRAGRLLPLATTGFGDELVRTRDPSRDPTIRAALYGLHPVSIEDPARAQAADVDVAAPIPDGAGGACGVLALWGVPDELRRDDVLTELEILAAYCAAPLRAAEGGAEVSAG